MTKETLMQLADAYGECLYLRTERQRGGRGRQALSDAIDQALAQARREALEEAAKYFQLNDTNLFWGSQAAREVRALKEQA